MLCQLHLGWVPLSMLKISVSCLLLHNAIKRVAWPPRTKKRVIYPESGKKRGEGNEVKPIKEGLISQLKQSGWLGDRCQARNSEGQGR